MPAEAARRARPDRAAAVAKKRPERVVIQAVRDQRVVADLPDQMAGRIGSDDTMAIGAEPDPAVGAFGDGLDLLRGDVGSGNRARRVGAGLEHEGPGILGPDPDPACGILVEASDDRRLLA